MARLYIDNDMARFTRKDICLVDVELYDGRFFENLEPRRLFPTTGLEKYITLLDSAGVEKAIIRDLNTLPPNERKIIEECLNEYYLVPKITREAPPVFLAATAEDMLTAYGALPVAKAYSDLGMPYELHVFQYGPHGYSLANEVTADGSSQVIDPAFAQWQELSVQWLHKTFGKPQFVDKSTSKMMQIMKDMGILGPEGKIGNFA